MAIGASVFNGVRSATITRALAETSAPAQVAKQMGWQIVTPTTRGRCCSTSRTWCAA
jgi:hypothetical protein